MKNIRNFSKLLIGTLITSSVFVACNNEADEAPYSTQYSANTSSLKSAGTAVDLGLPSGTMWADKNVGAASESDNGILFVWGDITGTQNLATDATYSLNRSTESALFAKFKGEETTGYVYDTTNVCKVTFDSDLTELDQAYIDSLTKKTFADHAEDKGKLVASLVNKVFAIDLIDSTAVKYFTSKASYDSKKSIAICDLIANAKYDPATANWGSSWQMPTKAQLEELIAKCTWEFTGAGYKVTGPNGNSIFLPAAGYRYGDKNVGKGTAGYYTSGEILGNYKFPSMLEQVAGKTGEISGVESMPNLLIFQHGQFDNSVKIYNNLTTNYAVSVRPVAK